MKTVKISLIAFAVSLSFSLFAQSFDLVWETEKIFKTPESVEFDESRNHFYISNINGKPLDKDGNGFISLLNTDGTVKTLKWVGGMDAPKGMTFNDSLLFVTDIDRFHIIDIEKAKVIKTIDVPGAIFLNDMEMDELGNVYITDMHKNNILKFNQVSGYEVWLDGDQIENPNGLAFFKGFLFVGTKDKLLKVVPEDKIVKVHIEQTGSIDGLIPLTVNKFVVSDWAGRIMLISGAEKIVLQNTTSENVQAADLGYYPENKMVLIPTFFDNRVVARKLP